MLPLKLFAVTVPATFTPVPVTTTTLALPTALMLTFPLALGMFTFEFPLARGPIKFPAVKLPATLNTPVPLKFAISVVPPYHLKDRPASAAGKLVHNVPESIPKA